MGMGWVANEVAAGAVVVPRLSLLARSLPLSEVTPNDTKNLRELTRDLRNMHRPKGTSAGMRCSECAVWKGGRLVRTPWPCDTIQLVESLPFVVDMGVIGVRGT